LKTSKKQTVIIRDEISDWCLIPDFSKFHGANRSDTSTPNPLDILTKFRSVTFTTPPAKDIQSLHPSDRHTLPLPTRPTRVRASQSFFLAPAHIGRIIVVEMAREADGPPGNGRHDSLYRHWQWFGRSGSLQQSALKSTFLYTGCTQFCTQPIKRIGRLVTGRPRHLGHCCSGNPIPH